jgi:hypothetical protein
VAPLKCYLSKGQEAIENKGKKDQYGGDASTGIASNPVKPLAKRAESA